MNATVGAVFGWVIVIAYSFTILNYILKFINRKWGKEIRKNEKLKGPFQMVMSFIVRNHRIFGFITLGGILVHFFIQFSRWGLVASGAVAAGLMFTQAGLGAFGTYIRKKKKGPWLIAHRIVAVLLLLAIIYHIVYVKRNYSF
ncbi:hypothetical protein [Proteiniclasticum sp.]|uniref:hypothetical protein n=1 Tax=Proteiniclasticum sp. TaxID=2053595 RepID=UPI0028A09488|nr:hypothetical protein [Proteiniclasticum sp.]